MYWPSFLKPLRSATVQIGSSPTAGLQITRFRTGLHRTPLFYQGSGFTSTPSGARVRCFTRNSTAPHDPVRAGLCRTVPGEIRQQQRYRPHLHFTPHSPASSSGKNGILRLAAARQSQAIRIRRQHRLVVSVPNAAHSLCADCDRSHRILLRQIGVGVRTSTGNGEFATPCSGVSSEVIHANVEPLCQDFRRRVRRTPPRCIRSWQLPLGTLKQYPFLSAGTTTISKPRIGSRGISRGVTVASFLCVRPLSPTGFNHSSSRPTSQWRHFVVRGSGREFPFRLSGQRPLRARYRAGT